MSKHCRKHPSVFGRQRACRNRQGSVAFFAGLSVMFLSFVGMEWALGSIDLLGAAANLALVAFCGFCSFLVWSTVRSACPTCQVRRNCQVFIRRRP